MCTKIDNNRQFLYMFLSDCKYYLDNFSLSLNEEQKEAFQHMMEAAEIVKRRYGLPDQSDHNNLDRKATALYAEFKKRNENVCLEFFHDKYKEIAGKFGDVPTITNFWLEYEKEWNATHDTPLFENHTGEVRVATIEFSEGGKRYDYMLDDDSTCNFYPSQRISLITGSNDYRNMTIVELKYYKSKPAWVTTKLKGFEYNKVIAYSI